MGFPKTVFRIIENRKCPLFEYGDVFAIAGIAIAMNTEEKNSFITTSVIHSPPGKKNCKILDGDLTKIVIQYERSDKIPICLISCSGCTGNIKLEHTHEPDLSTFVPDNDVSENIVSMMHLISSFSFFKTIDKSNLEKVIRFFQLNTYKKGQIVIRKGEPGGNFFIIVSGSVNVLNEGGITISTLEKGDVFGEMSLICNESVSATIQVREATSIIYIDRSNFQKIIEHYPAIQHYFSRLMADRLTKSNIIRSQDLSSGIVGNLSEIPSEALFQTLNMNSKTGILTIDGLINGTARFSFRQGSLIKAKYDQLVGEKAFYEILKEDSGRFRFTPGIPPGDFETPEIGYFMKLLMEGMRRLDEIKDKKVN